MTDVPLERCPHLSALTEVVHGFTTRRGGISPAPRDTLSLAVRSGIDAAEVVENWGRVAGTLGVAAERLALMTQVHGHRVVRVSTPTGPRGTVGEADAMFTTEPSLMLAVRTADCVPVLVAGPGVVGVAHAGWRGVAAAVVCELVSAIVAATGRAPGELVAAVGPSISGSAYEVGPEVVAALVDSGLGEPAFRVDTTPGARPRVDLQRAVVVQLGDVGVTRVDVVRRCTATDPDLYSHRANGPATGRQAGVIARSVA